MPQASGIVRDARPLVIAPEAAGIVAALVRRADRIPDLDAVVLFGSSTDGTFDKRSDIDLLLLFDAPDPERTHADAVLAALRVVRREARTRREITPVLAPRRRAVLDRDFLHQVARSGVVVWARPQRWLPLARDAGRVVLLLWDPSTITAAQRTRIHRSLFGERGRKTVRGRTYRWSTPGLIPKDHHYGPGTLIVPLARAAEVERVLRKCGAIPRRREFVEA